MGLEVVSMIVGIVVGVLVPLAMIFTLLHVFHLKSNSKTARRMEDADDRLNEVERRLKNLRSEYHAKVEPEGRRQGP